MSDPIAAARRAFAEDLRRRVGLRSKALVAAFASVPRERFCGPPPWRVRDLSAPVDRFAVTADPRRLYCDGLVSLDRERGINNGQPSLWARVFDRLDIRDGMTIVHLGCGTGYYSAILAEAAGPDTTITAIEIEADLAARARAALVSWPQIRVIVGDGAKQALTRADLVVASAGATHPLARWLDALNPGGELLFPMTSSIGLGAMLRIARRGEGGYRAGFLCGAYFIAFAGARDEAIGHRFAAAFARDGGDPVRSLRRDRHRIEAECWLHGDHWCLSRREAG
jgi:protein-L-isoaspartate(D-aspartate) O-methyltransferase